MIPHTCYGVHMDASLNENVRLLLYTMRTTRLLYYKEKNKPTIIQ